MTFSTPPTTRRKPYGGMQMEGPLASWYAQITRDRRGPGYRAVELAGLGGYPIPGLDISHSFVRIATENARRTGVSIDFRHGDVAGIPFPAESFDFVTCTA